MAYPEGGTVQTFTRPTGASGISGVYTAQSLPITKARNSSWPSFLFIKGTEYALAAGYTPSQYCWAGSTSRGTVRVPSDLLKLRLLKNDPTYAQAWLGWFNGTTHTINYLVMKVNKLDGEITSSAVQVGAALTNLGNFNTWQPGARRVRWDAASDPGNQRFWMVHYEDTYVSANTYNPNPFGYSARIEIRATIKTNVGTATSDNTISMGTANMSGPTYDRYIFGNQDTRRPSPNQYYQDQSSSDPFGVKLGYVGANKVLGMFGNFYATITSPNNNTATFSSNSPTASGAGTTFTSSHPCDVNNSSEIVPVGTNYAVHHYTHSTGNNYLVPAYSGVADSSIIQVINHSGTPSFQQTHWWSRYKTYGPVLTGLGTEGGVTKILAGIGTLGATQLGGVEYNVILEVNNSSGVLTTSNGTWNGQRRTNSDMPDSDEMTRQSSLYPHQFDRGNLVQFADWADGSTGGASRYVNMIQVDPSNANEPVSNFAGDGTNYDSARYQRGFLKIDQNQFLEVGYASSNTTIYGRLATVDPVLVSNNDVIA